MSIMSLPVIHSDAGLVRYLKEINKFPILTEKEEYELASKWKSISDLKAAHQLVTSHLRLVAKLALKYTGYGLPMVDIISEGNLGLMHAVKKFDPDNGNRFSTYAIWWIKAYIQDYILKSWSLVKIGTSAAKKKLFYNLNKIKKKLTHENKTSEDHIELIANELDLSKDEVENMNNMLVQPTLSLNSHAYEDDNSELINLVADSNPNQEVSLIEKDDLNRKKNMLASAIETLNPREQDIVNARMLQEKPATLEALSEIHGISRERVRQIEAKAFNKLRSILTSQYT